MNVQPMFVSPWSAQYSSVHLKHCSVLCGEYLDVGNNSRKNINNGSRLNVLLFFPKNSLDFLRHMKPKYCKMVELILASIIPKNNRCCRVFCDNIQQLVDNIRCAQNQRKVKNTSEIIKLVFIEMRV